MILLLKFLLYSAQVLAFGILAHKLWKYRHPKLKYFLYYFIFIIVIEILGNIPKSILYPFTRSGVYNLYDIGTYSFFLWWFYRVINNRAIRILVFIYILGLVSSLLLENFLSPMSILVFVGTSVVIVTSTLYYLDLLRQEEAIDFYNKFEFWIITGFLLFNVGYLPIHFLISMDYDHNRLAVQFVNMILNIGMYGCFIKAFLCHQKQS